MEAVGDARLLALRGVVVVPVGTALPMTARASVLLVMLTAWVQWW